jgi:hypothetical protein
MGCPQATVKDQELDCPPACTVTSTRPGGSGCARLTTTVFDVRSPDVGLVVTSAGTPTPFTHTPAVALDTALGNVT